MSHLEDTECPSIGEEIGRLARPPTPEISQAWGTSRVHSFLWIGVDVVHVSAFPVRPFETSLGKPVWAENV